MEAFVHILSSFFLTIAATFGFVISAPEELSTPALDNGQIASSTSAKVVPMKSAPVALITSNLKAPLPKISPTTSLKETADFSVIVPTGWIVKTSTNLEGNIVMTLQSPDFNETLKKGDMLYIGYEGSWIARGDIASSTSQSYVDLKMSYYGQYHDKIIQKQISLDGNPAHQRRNTLANAQILTIYSLHNNREFVIRYYPESLNWTSKQDEILNGIISSFKFKD